MKELREKLGLTQLELASQSGVSLAHVQKIESKISSPTLEVVEKLLNVLGCSTQIVVDNVNPDELAQIGVPLLSELQARMKDSKKISIAQICYILKVNYYKALNNHDIRSQEAIEAYLLAFETHYPTLYKKLLKRDRTSLFQNVKTITGRHIKLRRMAISNINKLEITT